MGIASYNATPIYWANCKMSHFYQQIKCPTLALIINAFLTQKVPFLPPMGNFLYSEENCIFSAITASFG